MKANAVSEKIDRLWQNSARRIETKQRAFHDAVNRLLLQQGCPHSFASDLERLISAAFRDHEWQQRALMVDASFHQRTVAYEKSRKPTEHALTFAARKVRLERLEKRNVGRNKAIEAACRIEFQDLSLAEKRIARRLAELEMQPSPIPSNQRRSGKRDLVNTVAQIIAGRTGAARNSELAKDVIVAALDLHGFAVSPDTVVKYLKAALSAE